MKNTILTWSKTEITRYELVYFQKMLEIEKKKKSLSGLNMSHTNTKRNKPADTKTHNWLVTVPISCAVEPRCVSENDTGSGSGTVETVCRFQTAKSEQTQFRAPTKKSRDFNSKHKHRQEQTEIPRVPGAVR